MMEELELLHTAERLEFNGLWVPNFAACCIQYICVMSCNTHKKIADKFLPVLDPRNHPCHLHTTSEIPRTNFPCLNSVVINSRPWTLPINSRPWTLPIV